MREELDPNRPNRPNRPGRPNRPSRPNRPNRPNPTDPTDPTSAICTPTACSKIRGSYRTYSTRPPRRPGRRGRRRRARARAWEEREQERVRVRVRRRRRRARGTRGVTQGRSQRGRARGRPLADSWSRTQDAPQLRFSCGDARTQPELPCIPWRAGAPMRSPWVSLRLVCVLGAGRRSAFAASGPGAGSLIHKLDS